MIRSIVLHDIPLSRIAQMIRMVQVTIWLGASQVITTT